ncbi:hypothetical protein OQA88_7301 [Cercophora sp. LCS_1]
MKTLPTPTEVFTRRKAEIIAKLSVPDEEYADASPKGSVDAGIRQLIDELNRQEGLVTTSSCAGRVSVYLEGRKSSTSEVADGAEDRVQSSAGGKGGGEWLYVSHDPLDELDSGSRYAEVFGVRVDASSAVAAGAVDLSEKRLIHFKFEPMILHVLTASLEHAQLVIQAGMEAGFRESGAVGILARRPEETAMPMVAVRSMGLAFESVIGVETEDAEGGSKRVCIVDNSGYLTMLAQIANKRFAENQKRVARFQTALKAAFMPKKPPGWEDAETRKERKRQEGLRRKDELKSRTKPTEEGLDLGVVLQEPDVL